MAHLGLSMALLKHSVDFGDGKEAGIIIVLAAEDQEKHLPILKDIRKIFRDKENIEKLRGMETAEEASSFITSH